MKTLLKNWNAIRIMRLLLAVGFAIYAIGSTQYLFFLIAVFLLLQVIFHNTLGCCGSTRNCNTTLKK